MHCPLCGAADTACGGPTTGQAGITIREASMAEQGERVLVRARDAEGHTFQVTREDAAAMNLTVDEPRQADADEPKAQAPAENKARKAPPEDKGA